MAADRKNCRAWRYIMKITNEQFDAKLIEILNGMTAAQILAIPGVYEVVSEELNNEVIEAIEADA
jgi:hypothetical protein